MRGHAEDPLADPARVELARMAFGAGELDAANGYLDSVRGDAVAEPATYLRCRVALASRTADAVECLARFRARFPASPHLTDALAAEAAHRAEAGDCERARPLLEAAIASHPSRAVAEALRAELTRCAAR